ncbi:DNA gyrase subunit A [Lachnospiraceae bacterium TWA4]|nr:DNA gyrase subunit A [Lachnospiraceae bacterium TWA4]
MGVIGMKLDEGDYVVGMQLDSQGDYLLITSANGLGKKTPIDEFTAQNRGGKGLKCYKVNEKTGDIVAAKMVRDNQELMIITTEGIIIRIAVDGISTLGRITSGVKLIDVNVEAGVSVASVAKVRESYINVEDNTGTDVTDTKSVEDTQEVDTEE